MNVRLTRVLALVSALNIFLICFYFLHFHPSHDGRLLHTSENAVMERNTASINGRKVQHFDGKPWPDLPSYMPWQSDPKPAIRSCEAYFGNGFNRPFPVLEPEVGNRKLKANLDGKLSKSRGGSFHCSYSETLQSSICEAKRIVMHPDRIQMSKGGEDLDSVIGRNEEAELPSFSVGAFEIEAGNHRIGDGRVVSPEMLDQFMPQGAVHTHTMRSLLDNLRAVSSNDFVCSQLIEEPTLFVTRFEYANLFHTFTDWYSAYVTSRVAGLPKRPRVDGHCKVNIVNGLFAHMSMIDQVRAVQAASVIVGAHGAALTHVIAARPGTVVLEIISSFYRRPHFALISQWTGLDYHAINLEGSVAKCSEVVGVLSGILEGLGC